MRVAKVFYNGELAGILTEESGKSYKFRYTDSWFYDLSKPSVSLTLPRSKQEYGSDFLFPFFFNMLSEGFNRQLQSKLLRIDENDFFGLLIASAQYDTIGAVTVKPVESNEA